MSPVISLKLIANAAVETVEKEEHKVMLILERLCVVKEIQSRLRVQYCGLTKIVQRRNLGWHGTDQVIGF